MEPKQNLLDLRSYSSEITHSDSYRRARMLGGQGIKSAISQGATELVAQHTTETGHRSAEGHVLNVIARVERFADGSQQLDRLRSGHSTREQRKPQLRKVIEFNHAIKELIDQQPHLGFREVLGFVTQVYASSHADNWHGDSEHRREQIGWFNGEVRAALSGMRHELAAEQIIGAIPDGIEIEYDDDSSDEERINRELNGIDMTVLVHGVPVDLDVKASSRSADEHNAQAASYRDSTTAIWSHAHDEDFIPNGFRLPPKVAAARAEAMKQDLIAARNSDSWRKSA